MHNPDFFEWILTAGTQKFEKVVRHFFGMRWILARLFKRSRRKTKQLRRELRYEERNVRWLREENEELIIDRDDWNGIANGLELEKAGLEKQIQALEHIRVARGKMLHGMLMELCNGTFCRLEPYTCFGGPAHGKVLRSSGHHHLTVAGLFGPPSLLKPLTPDELVTAPTYIKHQYRVMRLRQERSIKSGSGDIFPNNYEVRVNVHEGITDDDLNAGMQETEWRFR